MTDKSISWDSFKVLNDPPYDAFQKLAKRLVCAEYAIDSAKLDDPANYPGVECKPFNYDGEMVSFQAKFSDSNSVPYTEFRNSLEVVEKHTEAGVYYIDVMVLCTNAPPPTPKVVNGKKTGLGAYEKLEDFASAIGIRIEWWFGTNIVERLETTSNPSLISLRKFFFDPGPQPELLDPRNNQTFGTAKFHYSAQLVPYVPRPSIETELSVFLSSPDDLLWHSLVGVAGVGKSRLLLEVCENLGEKWNWGWWTKGNKFDFSNWHPTKPTLIIVDYVMGRLEDVGMLFDALLTSKKMFEVPVRVVVSERLLDPWLDLLVHRPVSGAAISASAFRQDGTGRPTATTIEGMQSGLKVKLAESVLESCVSSKFSAKDLVDATESIDNLCRPLFMSIVAERFTDSSGLPDLITLLREYISSQRTKHWQPAKITETDEYLSAIVTMVGGLMLEKSAIKSPKTIEKLSELRVAKHEVLVGAKISGNVLPPFEPDILGELHALDILDPASPLGPSRLAEGLELSAGVDGGFAVVGFLYRAAADFPRHPVLSKLEQTGLSPFWHANIATYLTVHLTAKGENYSREIAWDVIESLMKRLEGASGDDKFLVASGLAKTAIQISFGTHNSEDYKKILNLEEIVRKLAVEGENSSLLIDHSKAAANTINNNSEVYATDSQRLQVMNKWAELATLSNYPFEGLKQMVTVCSTRFSNAVNVAAKNGKQGVGPDQWFAFLEKAVQKAKDPQHCDIVFASSVSRAYEQLSQTGKYVEADKYVSALINHVSVFGPPTQYPLPSILYGDAQRLKNSGHGNPNSANLLKKLAIHDPQAQVLAQHV